MRKQLTLFIMIILLLGQTIFTPIASVGYVFAEGIDDQGVEEANDSGENVEDPDVSDNNESDEKEGDQDESGDNHADNQGDNNSDNDSDNNSNNSEANGSDNDSNSDNSANDGGEENADNTSNSNDEEEDPESDEVDEAYETALAAVEKALDSKDNADIEAAFELVNDLEDKAQKEELLSLLSPLLVTTFDEVNDDYFTFEASDILDLDNNPYGDDNPLGLNDEFWYQIDWALENGHDYKNGDYVEIPMPEQLSLTDGASGDLNDGNQTVATYEVVNGVVTITFTDYVENHSEITGHVQFKASLDKTKVEDEDGKIVIDPIQDEGQLEIPFDQSTVDKTVEKQGQPNKGYNADEIEWTVTYNKKGLALKDVKIEDVLPEGTEYKDGSLTVTKQKVSLNGDPLGEVENVPLSPSVADGTLSLDLGSINDVYTITYTTKVTDDDKKDFKNAVTAIDGSGDTLNTDATVTINRGEPLKKGAVKNYDPKTGIIEWYLEFNYNQKDLNDVTLGDNWKPEGKVELVDGSVKFQEMTINENGQASAVGESEGPIGQLTKQDNGFEISGISTDKPYYVTYQTKVKERELDGFRMENLASFDGHEYGEGYNIGQYVGQKSAGNIDYKNKTIEWTIKVNMDERQMNDVIIKDTLGEGLSLVKDSVEMTIGGTDYTGFDVVEGNPFKLTNIGDTDKEIVVKYKTKFVADDVPNLKPENKANISWIPEGASDRTDRDVKANTELNKETVDSSWKNGTYDPNTKEITWEVIVNYRENAYDDLNIQDTLHGNQALIESSVKVSELQIKSNGSYEEVGPAGDITTDGNEINIQIGQTNKAYKITYKSSLKGLEDISKTYKNTALVNDGDKTLSNLDASIDAYGARKYGDKRGAQDGKQVHWSIDVNLAQEKISNLALLDKISGNQDYVEESIKVYKATIDNNGKAVKGDALNSTKYSVEVEDEQFTINWAETVESAFIVEYSTLFFAGDGEKVRNDYTISGDGITADDKDASDGYEETINLSSSGSASGTAGYLQIHKIDSTYGQSPSPLGGIEFELIDKANNVVLKTVKTDEDGYADFGRLLFGDYILHEVDAPEGYYIPEQDKEITIDQAYEKGESDPLDYTVEVENYKPNHDVELVKRDEEDFPLKGVEFTLYTASGEEVAVQETDGGGEITFEDLEVGSYYVQETKALNGFELDDTKHEFEITAGQRDAIDLGKIVNKHKETSVTLNKLWSDQGDDSLRPDSVTVNLFQNGVYHSSHEITEADGWEITVDGLHAEDENGEPYEYTMTEQEVPGYEPSFSEDGLTVTNTRSEDRDITITKSWIDEGEENRRPESITVELFRSVDGEEAQSVGEYDLKPEDDWKLTIKNLPMFTIDGNKVYNYTVEEIEMNYPDLIQAGDEPIDYITTVDGFDITNKVTGTVQVHGTKHWNDDGDEEDRPESITIKLLQNGEEIDEQTIKAEDDWKYSFENLSRFNENGRAYHYEIEEEAVFGYQTVIASVTPIGSEVMRYEIYNTRTGSTGLFGSKTWVDNDNAENTRPGSIEVEIYQNGDLYSTETLSEDNGWMYGMIGLPAYDKAGVAYEYTAEEIEVDGYETTYDGDNIINTLVGETEVSITKAWQGEAADEVEVQLLADDETIDTVTLSAEEDWTHTFTGLAKYDSDGAVIDYTVEEVKIDGYASVITGDAEEGYTITNTRTGKTEVPVEKKWQGSEEDGATINLLANGEETDQSIELSEENNWADAFNDLEAFDSEGQPIEYTIKEVADEDWENDYITEITGDAEEGFVVTNTRTAETEVSVEKVWQGEAADSITVTLYGDGEEMDSVDLTEEDDWKHVFTELPKYDESGEAIAYIVNETPNDNYKTTLDGSHEDGFTITNTRTGETEVSVEKVWVDNDDEANERPDAITVELLQNGNVITDAELTAEEDWAHTFTSLDGFDEEGQAYEYTVEEVEVDGYKVSIEGNAEDGFTIMNTKTTPILPLEPITKVDVEKVWEGKVLDEVMIQLLADEEVVDDIVLSDENDWTYTFNSLPKYSDDNHENLIEYTVEEVEVDGYNTEITGDSETGFTITNTEKTYALGDYTWVDKNKDGIQDDNEEVLEGVKVELFDENGDKVGETTTDENGRYLFDDLPAGKYKVKFTLTDEQAEKYKFTKQNSGDDVTNDSDADENGWTTEIVLDDDNEQLTKDYDRDFNATEGIDPTWDAGVIELVNISVEKVWVDNDDQEEVRPDEITVNLLANGEEVDSIQLSDENNWTHHFKGLDKYDANGEVIEYVVEEVQVDGYKVSIEGDAEDGFVITNTKTAPIIPLEPITKVDVEKVWEGKALNEVVIQLLADGEVVDDIVLSDENDWKHTFNSLPKFSDQALENAVEYTVNEIEVEGYEVSIDGNAEDGFVVTNTFIEEDDPKEDPITDDDDSDDETSVSDDSTDNDDAAEGELPKTATNTFNFIAVGLALILFGIALTFIRRKFSH